MAKNCLNKMDTLVVNAFKNVIKNVGPTEGKIGVAGSKIVVSSTWSQRNVDRRTNMQNKFIQMVELDNQVVTNLHAVENSTELMTNYSPSFNFRSVLRDVPPSRKKATKKQHLEIWQHNKMVHLFDLTGRDIHGDVYTDGEFGCLEWSPCETKLLYVAEQKKPKTEPFLPSPLKPSDDVSYGDEYVMVEDWGETLVGKSSPVLVVCNTVENDVAVVSPESTELSLGQGVWAPDGSIVCVGWETQPRRLGKVYCTNRSSCLLHISPDGKATKIGEDNRAVMSPKFSKDGKTLIWLERLAGGPHNACVRLMKMDWATRKLSIVVDFVEKCTTTSNGEPFFGIFATSLGSNCWLDDNKTVIISSTQRASIRMYAIDTDSKDVHDITGCSAETEPFSSGVLDVRGDLILAWRSSLLMTPSLLIGRFTQTSPIKWTCLVESDTTLSDYIVDVMRLESTIVTEVAKDFSAIYLGPKTGSSVPLIVFPHGGPHSASTNSYSMLATFFAKSGFAVLFINYRGSTGAGESSIKSLLGNVGTVDVVDCHQSTLKALETYSNILTEDKCILFGGSHGGFLVLHLSGQYPDIFKSTVALNPVVDLTAFASSDIPDWAMVESGAIYDPAAGITTKQFEAMKKMSPIIHVNQVKAPTLLLIGKTDLRVPPSQGINYYYALKARGLKTKVLAYEDNHQLPKTPHEVDFAINTVLWYLDCIEHSIPQ